MQPPVCRRAPIPERGTRCATKPNTMRTHGIPSEPSVSRGRRGNGSKRPASSLGRPACTAPGLMYWPECAATHPAGRIGRPSSGTVSPGSGAGRAHLAARRLASLCAMQYPFLSRLNPRCPGGDDNQLDHPAGPARTVRPHTTQGCRMPGACLSSAAVSGSPRPGNPDAASPGSRRGACPAPRQFLASARRPAGRRAWRSPPRPGAAPGRQQCGYGRTGAGPTQITGLIEAASSRAIRGSPSSVQAMASPPPRQAATLSGCPSIPVASPAGRRPGA